MRRHGLNSTYCAGCRCDDCTADHVAMSRNWRMHDLERLFRPRPAWFDQAACTGLDPNLFHPVAGAVAVKFRAISICKRCPVREQCLEHFIDEPLGIYGGTTPTERVRLRRAREAAA